MRRLEERGVPRENMLFLNFFDDRLHGLGPAELSLITEAYFTLHPEKKGSEITHFFFDEIQEVAGWEPFVDRLLRTEKCEVTLTGSSSAMLSRDLASAMRGRVLSFELFPFSFGEFLDWKGIAAGHDMSTRTRLLVRKAFDDYWAAGGFPELMGLSKGMRVRLHQEYLNAILFRDIVERHDFAHPRALSALAHWMLDNAGSLYSVNKLTDWLRGVGHKISKTDVSECMAWFDDAFFLFTVRLFDASFTRSNANPKKAYCVDHALVSSTSSGILANNGHLLENLVFLALRRTFQDIFYYRTRSGKEVDFVVVEQDGSKRLIQVCETIMDERTQTRELAGLEEAMSELDVDCGTLVTREEEGERDLHGRIVGIVPAWKFLLEMEGRMRA